MTALNQTPSLGEVCPQRPILGASPCHGAPEGAARGWGGIVSYQADQACYFDVRALTKRVIGYFEGKPMHVTDAAPEDLAGS